MPTIELNGYLQYDYISSDKCAQINFILQNEQLNFDCWSTNIPHFTTGFKPFFLHKGITTVLDAQS